MQAIVTDVVYVPAELVTPDGRVVRTEGTDRWRRRPGVPGARIAKRDPRTRVSARTCSFRSPVPPTPVSSPVRPLLVRGATSEAGLGH